MPRSQVPWLIDQPDNVLSASGFHYDSLAGDYSFADPAILTDPYHEHVIHKYLPRRLNQVVPNLQDEVEHVIDEKWGMDTQWKDVQVWGTINDLMASLAHRSFVGLPLCRNKDYLQNMSAFTMDVVSCCTIVNLLPGWLQPLLGPIVSLPNRRHWRRSARYSEPLIRERLEKFQRKRQDPSFKWEAPEDYLSWHIELATAENRQDELTVERIGLRLMPINFAAMHTTQITTTNLLVDITAADPKAVEKLRDEAAQSFADDDGHWTKAGLNKMVCADSAIRESMRVSNFMTRNVTRKVIAEDGITNEAEGWHAPKGSYISTDMHGVQHDPEIYPDPETFDMFRFSRPKEDKAAPANGHAANGNAAGHQNKSATPTSAPTPTPTAPTHKNTDVINTSDIFLPFSHGRHACPGRFLVALEIKIILAYILLNYDIEPLQTRPERKWMGEVILPPMKQTLRIRRKVDTVKKVAS